MQERMEAESEMNFDALANESFRGKMIQPTHL